MSSVKLSALFVMLVLTCRVAIATAQIEPGPVDPRDPLLNQGPKAEAVGEKVMVSTQLPIVTETAVQVLREGGNAVDAAIAATFLQNVVDYHQVSLFGAMTGLYYEAATGKYYAFNAYGAKPLADRAEHGDPMKVSIAGKVLALEQLWKRFGTREWASYVEPAIRAAEEGFVVTSFMYGNNYSLWSRGDLIQKNEQARDFYMPEGHLVPVGHRWKMPALAETLRKVAAQGSDYLYKGAWAQEFVEEANKRGGRVTLDDLAQFEVLWQEPVRFTYRDHEIVTEPPPVAGGLNLAYNLNILENFDLKKTGHYTKSAETLEIMVRAMGRVENEIRYAIGDPRSFHIPSALWLSKEYGKMGAEFVRMTLPKANLAPAKATDNYASNGPSRSVIEVDPYADDSNHNVIVDAQGNWITYLHTGHGGMPGVFVGGIRATGSGRWQRTSGPGRRFSTHVTATFVAKDGKPWLAIGSPGLPSQPVTEVLINIIDFGMRPKEAVDAPRFWAYRDRGVQRDFGNLGFLRIESRIADDTRKAMAARGIQIEDLGPYNWHTGSMQLVWREAATGKLHGVSDPRRLGHAKGF
jgi:gamma-glutamyltranspeptidase/glutathione hydrolase